jgi:hypothetical protein
MRRYQELIDAYIQQEMRQIFGTVPAAGGDMTQVKGDSLFPVLNMLNTRYFILPLKDGQTVPLLNPYAYGNAWLVDEVKYVDNANEELDALGRLPLRHVAVADKQFADVLGQARQQDSVSVVSITGYEPNQLSYDVETSSGGVGVFSEIFYPGWTATIDGQPAELGRVDYVLRALQVPAGKHKVELSFKPRSVQTTETVAYVSLGLLMLLVLVVIGFSVRKR